MQVIRQDGKRLIRLSLFGLAVREAFRTQLERGEIIRWGRNWKKLRDFLFQERARLVHELLRRSVVSIRSTARDLLDLDQNAWGFPETIESSRTVQKLIAVAECKSLMKADPACLPPDLETLYQLSRLPAELLERLLTAGAITPSLQEHQVRNRWQRRH